MTGYMDNLDYWVRIFVTGVRKDKDGKTAPAGFLWADRFMDHPWVRDSITQGWERDLRSHVIRAAKRLVMQRDKSRGQFDVSMRTVMDAVPSADALMPDKDWCDRARQRATDALEAVAWRNDIAEQFGSLEEYLRRRKPSTTSKAPKVELRPVGDVIPYLDRKQFEQMQSASPNRRLHRELSTRSRAMTGEAD